MKKTYTTKSVIHFVLIFVTTILFVTTSSTFAQTGRIENVVVHSQALEGNLLGDSPDRAVTIYLPSAYDSLPGARFSVIYMLHGYTTTNGGFMSWIGQAVFDNFFSQATAQPMIIVIPNAYNAYKGSWYTNSIVTGNWEDFITQELVEYIDTNYRTIPHNLSRGISGHSMGGYGAMKLAMKHPEIYSAVYSLSGAHLDFETAILGTYFSSLLEAANAPQFPGLTLNAQALIAAGAAFAPNINPHPFYCDFPIDTNGVVIDSVWQRWLQHDPFSLIPTYRENLLQLNIQFDCGLSDLFIDATQSFDSALTAENIPHTFLTYPGDHFNKIPERVEDHMLPFFSEILDSLQMPAAPILIEPIDSVNVPEVEFIWTSNYPAIDRYWFEIDTTDLFTTSFIDSMITDTTYLYSNLQNGKDYWWRVKAHNSLGWGEFSEVATFFVNITSVEEEEIDEVPIDYSLSQNYPNPFNPSTKIKYSVPQSSNVVIKVFDVLGNEVAILVNEEKPIGTYEVEFNSHSGIVRNLTSGVYFYQLNAGEFINTKKMLLLK